MKTKENTSEMPIQDLTN